MESVNPFAVIPAKAGTQSALVRSAMRLGSRFRGNDDVGFFEVSA